MNDKKLNALARILAQILLGMREYQERWKHRHKTQLETRSLPKSRAGIFILDLILAAEKTKNKK